jgi:hypothetical protein
MNILKAKLLVVRRHWYQQGQIAEYQRIVELLEDSNWAYAEEAIAFINGEVDTNE